MTERFLHVGNNGPLVYDDTRQGQYPSDPMLATHAVVTDGQLYVAGTPTAQNHVVRKRDLDSHVTSLVNLISAATGGSTEIDLAFFTSVTWSSGVTFSVDGPPFRSGLVLVLYDGVVQIPAPKAANGWTEVLNDSGAVHQIIVPGAAEADATRIFLIGVKA